MNPTHLTSSVVICKSITEAYVIANEDRPTRPGGFVAVGCVIADAGPHQPYEPGTSADSLIDAHEAADQGDLDVLIRTGFESPVAIGLAKGFSGRRTNFRHPVG